MNSIDQLWDELLSGDPIRIKRTYEALGDSDRLPVFDHLSSMTTEEDWHPSQKRSAKIGFETIKKFFN